jgi:hypothetical protein
VHLHFTYHSRTQRTLHGMPFALLVCASGWAIHTTDESNELAQIGAMLAFGWLLLANFLMNAMIRHWGARFGPIDLSKNVSPTGIEILVGRMILLAAVAAGVVAAAMAVPGVIRGGMETKIFVAGAVFFLVAAMTYGTLILAVIVLSGFRLRPLRG